MLEKTKTALISAYAAIAPTFVSNFLLACGARGLGAGVPVDLAREIEAAAKAISGISNPIVFDVGANVGGYALGLRAKCPSATIYAFEPGLAPFAELAAAAEIGSIKPFQLAVGAAVGERTLYDRADDTSGAHASLVASVITDLIGQEATQRPVEVTTVDAFAAARGIQEISLLKIDVEGAELDVLRGAAGYLARHAIRVIQFEFGECHTMSRIFMRDFFDILPAFDFYRIAERRLVPLPPTGAVLYSNLFAYQNVIAVRKAAP